MKKLWLIIIFYLFGVSIMANTKTTLNELATVLPTSIDGWQKANENTFYTPGNLFKYIDGGAELYISYNFQQVLAQEYTKGQDNEINVDIFDMQNSFNAFGIFAHSSEKPGTGSERIGQGSEYAGGLLTFWKDKFYISILAYPETEEKKKIVLQLGRALAGAIPTEGALPPVISLLPKENLVPAGTRYFYHYIWLNSHYFISDRDILGLDQNTQAALAKYNESGEKFFILLVLYPGQEKAQAAFKSFQEYYFAGAVNNIKQLENRRWTGCKLEDNLIAAILDAPNRETVERFLIKIKNKKS
ncbi:MAG: hypothetical protein MUF15_15110 [Acidobacteria bacterium]|nr:hypothetical protein [Acidobacteriota bacterium]